MADMSWWRKGGVADPITYTTGSQRPMNVGAQVPFTF